MRRFSGLLMLGGLSVICSSALAQSTAGSAAPSAATIKVMAADGKTVTPTYLDAKGSVIDAQAFLAGTRAGLKFDMTHGKDSGAVIFKLLPRGTAGGTSMTTAGKPDPTIGKALPDFQLSTVSGLQVSPTALVGQPTLVDFFFADCVACIEELPALNAYAAQHPDMNFLAVTFDDAQTAKDFVKERQFEWPVAYDGKRLTDELSVVSYPTMLLLDASGNVLASHSGSIPISVTQVTSSGSKPSFVEPSAGDAKKSQMKWLDEWVKEGLATPVF